MQGEEDQSSDQAKMMKQNNSNNNNNNNNNNNDKVPQKCPRCESLNTKFCYYNNYSLSQPRYFCKTCRRYWTQGGTLRNVPVGGGCRKGKRARTTTTSTTSTTTSSTTSSSGGGTGDNSRQVISQAVLPPQQNQTTAQTIIGSGLMRAVEPAGLFGSQYYQVPGSYLSSFAGMNQSFNQGADHDSDDHDHLSLGNQLGMITSSSLSLLEGFNMAAFGSQQQHQIQPSNHQFYNPSDHHQTMISSMPISTSSSSRHDHQWPPSFAVVNNNSDSMATQTTTAWTMGAANSVVSNVHTSTTSGSGGGGDDPSLNPNQWPHHHDLPGSYGPPP